MKAICVIFHFVAESGGFKGELAMDQEVGEPRRMSVRDPDSGWREYSAARCCGLRRS